MNNGARKIVFRGRLQKPEQDFPNNGHLYWHNERPVHYVWVGEWPLFGISLSAEWKPPEIKLEDLI